MTEITNNEHATTDLGEAAYLKLQGFRIKRFNRDDPNNVVIVFQGDPSLLQKKALDYFGFKTNVDAKSLFDSIKQVKKAILEGKPRYK